MGIGVYALIIGTIQTMCFEICSYKGTNHLKKEWFYSLLRQDSSYFDVYNISGIANTLNPQSNKYRRGLGRKFGEGVQFFTTGVGGVVYALYAEWRVALVVLSFCPVIGFFAMNVVKLNQTKSERSAQAYSNAGSIAYSTVSGIKTVLSLNACTKIIAEYKKATQHAFVIATGTLIKQGFVNGMMLGSFLIMYIILTLDGCYLIYIDVQNTGCDPSGGVTTNITCRSSGPDVFGAMLGIAFAAQGIGQVGTFLETFSTAKVAAGQALTSIRRIPGEGKSASEEIIYHVEDKKDKKNKDNGNDDTNSVSSGRNSSIAFDESIETPKGRIKAILPPYEINSLSDKGLSPNPKGVQGNIQFNNVIFNYPTRPSHQILNGLSIQIKEGSTIAFVGPSGGGKSTIGTLYICFILVFYYVAFYLSFSVGRYAHYIHNPFSLPPTPLSHTHTPIHHARARLR
jgi:ATP-binding cassette subfamily B (MDR/TAP) protein 1